MGRMKKQRSVHKTRDMLNFRSVTTLNLRLENENMFNVLNRVQIRRFARLCGRLLYVLRNPCLFLFA